MAPSYVQTALDDEQSTRQRRLNEVRRRLAPHATGGTYINFENPYVEGRDAAVYGDNARRVLAIRSKYDPLGLFAPRP